MAGAPVPRPGRPAATSAAEAPEAPEAPEAAEAAEAPEAPTPLRPEASAPGRADDDLLLKVTPPRAARDLLARARLMSDDPRLRGHAVMLVQAPAGFGKTSLLAQWRREHLARGAVVAWVSAQPRDHPRRLVQALALAVRVGAGRPSFGRTLIAAPAGGLEGVTAWLAEVAQSALDLVLFVDEADRLPAEALEALAYLLRNAPPNLRVVVAARPEARLGVDDLAAYGQCVALGANALRFTLDETLGLVRERFGARFDPDAAARLHELTEGWPLGLQLALSVIAGGGDPRAAVGAMAAQGAALRERFVGLLLAKLDADDVAFLERVAIVDLLHPDLCAGVTGAADAGERLARLARDTPVFVAGEYGDWMRLHTLARDELRRRFEGLPATERSALHARAAQWLAGRGLLEDAARHALAAGQDVLAYELAERSLYDSIMVHGRQSAVLDWLARLPPGELDRRPGLRLAAAWSLALSERHVEAGRVVERILARPAASDALRCECALILSGAAIFADDPDRFAELHDPWAAAPPLRDPLLVQVHANRSAYRALVEGDPALARLRLQQAPRPGHAPGLGYIGRWGEFVTALTYLWDGQVRQAESLLRASLPAAEAELGRRSPFVCMLAALLAAAVWEGDRPDEARALLANRLDVLERGGLPEAVLLGYRTMARIAAADGADHRALELLGALHAVGVARGLPRLAIASLADQVRMHARHFRPESCREPCERIDALLADAVPAHGPLWRRHARLLREQAYAGAAIAAQQWPAALDALVRAEAIARPLAMGRVRIELMALRALALERCGEESGALFAEAVDLARTYGLTRVFTDAHPALGERAGAVAREAASGRVADAAGRVAGASGRISDASGRAADEPGRVADARGYGSSAPRATQSTALTPKEREVLELLARNLSNKEIGLALQVGEETIKWHLKNLFAKLDAGSRKQVVRRARILGLLEAGD